MALMGRVGERETGRLESPDLPITRSPDRATKKRNDRSLSCVLP